MRTLLTFIGSVICFIITVIISPLLAAVYAGIGISQLTSTIYLPKPTLNSLRTKLPAVHLPAKQQLHTLWQRALRLH